MTAPQRHVLLTAWAVRASGEQAAALIAEVDAYFGEGDRADCGIVPPPCGGCYRCVQMQVSTSAWLSPSVFLQHVAQVAAAGGRHVPVQIGTRDAEGERTHTRPGDVCAACSDSAAGRWTPVSECAAATAALDELERWMYADGDEPAWCREMRQEAGG